MRLGTPTSPTPELADRMIDILEEGIDDLLGDLLAGALRAVARAGSTGSAMADSISKRPINRVRHVERRS